MDENFRKALWLLAAIVAMMTLLAIAGCKSVEKVREVTRTDTCFIDKWQRDSIVIETMKHDSVCVQQRGDTVIFTHWRTEYRDRWRDRISHDSIYIAHRDTVIVETVLKEEKKLSWWQQARMAVGSLTIILLGAIAGMKAFTIFKGQG